ncbi:MAG: hypothetical protein HKL85_07670 [Acidimicrobiaceae bacterium]|nr:hypothetical protein [Acidimicrobiaceae bacterium]
MSQVRKENFIYLIVTTLFPMLARQLPHSSTETSVIRVRYPDGRCLLREVLELASARGFTLSEISTGSVGYQRQPESSVDRTNER